MQSNNRLNPITFADQNSNRFENPAMLNNHLETLKVFSSLMLQEIENLRRDENLPTSQNDQNINLSEAVQKYEADLIRSALVQCGGRQRKAAKLLGVKFTTLNSKIKRLGIEMFPLARSTR